MSYPKKSVKENSVSGKGNSKLTEERRQRLEAIQQREQLKGLIVNKFIEKYGAKQQQHSAFIDNEVNNFIRSEKVTEESLRKLESRIKKGMNIKDDDTKSVRSLSKAGQQVLAGTQMGRDQGSKPGDLPSLDNPLTSENLQKLPSQHGSRAGSKAGSRRDPEGMSIAGSSMAPKSVYQLGDEDDEWAMIIKFDQELYKKEREMEKMREKEQRSKIQRELDHLMEEKKFLKGKEQEDMALYNEMQKKQWELYDKREKEKEEEKKKKIMYEKLSRDKQLQEENRRKKLEKQREKEIDDLLVKKIKEELEMEQQTILQRKKEEKDHLMRVMRENEENKKRALEEMKQERLNDIRAQQEYAKLIEKQEQAREAEIKAREDKAKKFMAMMSDTVIKDQKEQILDEERKILKHYEEKAMKDKHEDDERQKKLLQQKKEMRDFLDRQVQERNEKKKMEEELSKRQAEFWQKDSQEYFDNEKKKSDYIRDVNKKHADILKEQMVNKPKKRGQGTKVKMNTAELLQNKQILKEIANREGENNPVQRNLVIATHKN